MNTVSFYKLTNLPVVVNAATKTYCKQLCVNALFHFANSKLTVYQICVILAAAPLSLFSVDAGNVVYLYTGLGCLANTILYQRQWMPWCVRLALTPTLPVAVACSLGSPASLRIQHNLGWVLLKIKRTCSQESIGINSASGHLGFWVLRKYIYSTKRSVKLPVELQTPEVIFLILKKHK